MALQIRHPFEGVAAGRRLPIFGLLLALTLVMMVALNRVGNPPPTDAAPLGIVSFELAGSVSQARAMIDSWDEAARLRAAFGLGLDFLFMVTYSITLGFACAWVASAVRARGWRSAAAGNWLAWGQWLAAGLDAVENVALVIVLLGSIAAPWPSLAWWCAIFKFALIGAGLLYAALGAVALAVFRKT